MMVQQVRTLAAPAEDGVQSPAPTWMLTAIVALASGDLTPSSDLLGHLQASRVLTDMPITHSYT